MRLAWFHPAPLTPAIDASDAVDLALELARSHVVDQFDAATAHDFVWRHFNTPYDLTVFELGDTPAYTFVWPYVFTSPGIVVLRSGSLQRSRSDALLLAHRHRHLRAERAFSGWTFLRAPLAASRMVVVHDSLLARELAEDCPGVNVRVVPVGVAPAVTSPADGTGRFVIAGSHHDVAERAAARAREAGADVVLTDSAATLTDQDVLMTLDWPPSAAPPSAALRAMAAGIPAIVLETEAVAAWPMLDPQTWQPRGYLRDVTPIGVSIDPRDEEHSLMLAMRRLATDATLRDRLGTAARDWVRRHADVRRAAAAWEPLLLEARALRPLADTTDLPPHLSADGTQSARRILSEFDVKVDFLES